jgi:hypothetical protein
MSKTLPRLPKEEKMDDKNAEIVKEINTLLLTVTGYPGDTKEFRVFKSFTGYFYIYGSCAKGARNW